MITFLHGAASSSFTSEAFKIVTVTLPDSIITQRAVPWCWLEAPKKVIVSIILYHFSHHFLICLACSITMKMPYFFRQGNLPKLDVQVDRGSDFTVWTAKWESYMSFSELSEVSDEKKVQALTMFHTRNPFYCSQPWSLQC